MIRQADLQGHWVRDWIKAPGFEDHTTRVHWMQAGRDYADVRIPAERPDLQDCLSLADLPAQDLGLLLQAEGFAGQTALDGDACTWVREINWHGEPDAADIGRISFDADGRMIEEGVLASYTELWGQTATSATRSMRVSGEGYAGVVVLAGPDCVLGIGRHGADATGPLIADVQAGQVPGGIAELFGRVHALCRVENDSIIAELATQPLAEGRPIVTLAEGTVIWHRVDFWGRWSEVVLQVEAAPT